MKKFTYGTPFETDAVVERVERTEGDPSQFTVERTGDAFVFRRPLSARDRVYGLGEQVRGINKRGWLYDGWNTDDPRITEGRTALYGAHNFIVLTGEETFGVFFDSAGRVVFDVGYEDPDELKITAWNADVYVIEGGSAKEVVHTFRTLIGRSYIPPKWAFGYGQSKWGYKTEEDIRAVVEGYRANGFPLDAVYMDIDYMIHYKDFTVDPERYPDLSALSAELKAEGIYLVPIVDAAIKAEEGYPVYDEGLRNGYFCTDAAGVPYVVGVWPGDSVLPDVLAPEARAWFGAQYRALLDEGIEGFWNDMNEPALFYGKERLQKAIEAVAQTKGNLELDDFNKLTANFGKLANSPEDYRALCHNVNGKRVSHADVHNLYGYNMTRAAAEYFAEYAPDKRFLLFSRSSCIGMHRYGGIWTGDNCSWWSHLLLNVKMMPSLDMCGFLFAGADIGGHADNTTEELLLRWLAFGIFTPLMRNHATNGARDQECYRFKNKDAFRRILGMRYAHEQGCVPPDPRHALRALALPLQRIYQVRAPRGDALQAARV